MGVSFDFFLHYMRISKAIHLFTLTYYFISYERRSMLTIYLYRPSETKSKANHTPKPSTNKLDYDTTGAYHGRVLRQVNAAQEASDSTTHPLSKSLLDLLPTHTNNITASVRTIHSLTSLVGEEDGDVLYSFDKNSTPDMKATSTGLEGLVEQAERRFVAEQTDRIVRGEYEVIDTEGEKEVLGIGKKGRRGSPKQRAKVVANANASGSGSGEVVHVPSRLEDDDGFELV